MYKKDRFFVEDLIIPCCLEYALGNCLLGILIEKGVFDKGVRTPSSKVLIDKLEAYFNSIPKEENNEDREMFETYKKLCHAIWDECSKVPPDKKDSMARRVGRILKEIQEFFLKNHFKTRKIFLLTIEWAKILRDNNYIEVFGSCLPILEDVIDTYTHLLPEEQDNYALFHRSTLKQAIKLHAIVLKSGYFLGCPHLELGSEDDSQ